VVELQSSIRRLEHTLEDEERKLEDLSKKIRTDETGDNLLAATFFVRMSFFPITIDLFS
jgi:hypothetical protein